MKSIAATCLAVLAVSLVQAQQGAPLNRSRRPLAGQYIIVLRGPDADPLSVATGTAGLYGGRIHHVYRHALRGFAMRLPEPAVRALQNDPRVDYIEEDGLVSTADVQVSAPWGLDRIDQRFLPLNGAYSWSHAPRSIPVHVIDTGIRTSHADFGGRAFIGGDYVDDDGDGDPDDVGNDDGNPGEPDGADCHGHGTHVAGTVGGATYGVAKQVLLYAYRAIGCNGEGPNSAVIAAIDAVTATLERPAVVNVSLGGPPSVALDSAVRRAIESGLVLAIAAGNSNEDARWTSPARVTEAITVGAVLSTDARASYSNYGPYLDLFAPGSGILSAAFWGDFATTTMSGTSMAAPHVAGAAARYLALHPDASPGAVRDALVAAATAGTVSNAGPGSPNLRLYSGVLNTPPNVTVVVPNGGEKLYTGTGAVVEWRVENDDASSTQDVQFSTDNGLTFAPVPGCSGLPPAARTCAWAAPGPTTTKGRIRVVVTNLSGDQDSDVSNGAFSVISGQASITVTAPNSAVSWPTGSTQVITWNHNLGLVSAFTIELSRDGGATFVPIAEAVTAASSTTGSYPWQVTGPTTGTARVRVRWTTGARSDVSDTTFRIVNGALSPTAPAAGSNWAFGSVQKVKWTTNLGAYDLVDVLLSTDGGGTYPFKVATGIAATSLQASVTLPALETVASDARLRLVWANAGPGGAAAGTSPSFTLAPGFVSVTAPAGANWAYGTSRKVVWTTNLGVTDRVAVLLSTNGGTTYAYTLAASAAATLLSSTITVPTLAEPTAAARVRVAWVSGGAGPGVAGVSPVDFTIQEPFVRTTGPTMMSSWGFGTKQRVYWQGNLGIGDLVDILLSTDGGATFPVAIASGLAATALSAVVTVPTLLAGTTEARVQVTPARAAAVTPSAPFTVQPPFVLVTTPNGGESLRSGYSTAIRWTSNLGALENVRIELSLDGGVTFPVVATSSTPSDGSQAIGLKASWRSTTAMARVVWTRGASVRDTSDAVFVIR